MASARTDSRPGADRATALRPAGVRMMERIALGALTMILSVNVWTGRRPLPRQPAPWLLIRSADAARPARAGRRELNAVETIVILTVVAASILFEAWFFFFAKTVVPG
jgi:hypothetical protein